MMLTPALCLIYLSTVKAISEYQPCKHIIHCQCGFSNDTIKFCDNGQSTPEEVCKGLSQCTDMTLHAKSRFRCPEEETACRNGTIACPDPGFISKGIRQNVDGTFSSTRQVFNVGESVVYSCESSEYAIEGLVLLTCTNSGRWSTSLPRCTKVTAKRTRRQTDYNTRRRTNPYGPNRLRFPTNTTDCPDPGFVPKALRQTADGLMSTTPRRFKKGESVVFSCGSTKFALQGKSFLMCTSAGTWSSPLPKCISSSSSDLTCADPGFVTNGDRLRTDGSVSETEQRFQAGDSVVYTCHEGYALQSSSLITCTAEGKWSKKRPHCTSLSSATSNENTEDSDDALTYCRDPGTDANAVRTPIRPLLSRGFMQGARLEYTCNEGYYLQGDDELFCLNTGTWSSDPPTCRADVVGSARCNNPGPILNGVVSPKMMTDGELVDLESALQYAVGTRLEYSCEENHVLEGSSFLVCQEFGSWSAQPPSCFPTCGVSYADAVLSEGASITELKAIEEWPWAVTIQDGNAFYCNGVLLNANTVLTIANCVDGLRVAHLYIGRVQRILADDQDDLIVRLSTKIIVHPDYENDYRNDIAIIKFAPKIRYSEKTLPICLPTNKSTENNLRVGNMAFVGGFGPNFREDGFRRLMFGRLPIISNEECINRTEGMYNPTDVHFCSGSETAGWIDCPYDGSAVAFYDPENDIYVLEGVVRAGVCGQIGPGKRYLVVTKVQSFLPWIYENL